MTEEEEKHLLVFDLFNLDKVLWLKNTIKHYNIHPHNIRYNEIIDTSNFLHDKDFIEFLTVQPDNGIKLNSAGERYFEGLKKKKAKEALELNQIKSTIATHKYQRYVPIIALVVSVFALFISYNQYIKTDAVKTILLQTQDSIRQTQSQINTLEKKVDSLRVLRDTIIVSKNQKN